MTTRAAVGKMKEMKGCVIIQNILHRIVQTVKNIQQNAGRVANVHILKKENGAIQNRIVYLGKVETKGLDFVYTELFNFKNTKIFKRQNCFIVFFLQKFNFDSCLNRNEQSYREYRGRSRVRQERQRSVEKRERERSRERRMSTLPHYIEQVPVPVYYGVRYFHELIIITF